jgi:hypothetical protein
VFLEKFLFFIFFLEKNLFRCAKWLIFFRPIPILLFLKKTLFYSEKKREKMAILLTVPHFVSDPAIQKEQLEISDDNVPLRGTERAEQRERNRESGTESGTEHIQDWFAGQMAEYISSSLSSFSVRILYADQPRIVCDFNREPAFSQGECKGNFTIEFKKWISQHRSGKEKPFF